MATVKKAQVNHSPLPWARFDADSLEIAGADGHEICNVFQCGGIREIDEADANTALIVRAVNNHDALVSAMREFCDYYKGKEHQLGNGQARRSLDKFRAALAAAQETK